MWCHTRRGGPRELSKTADANLDCVFVENTLFLRLWKSQQNRIESVTSRPLEDTHLLLTFGPSSLQLAGLPSFWGPLFSRVSLSCAWLRVLPRSWVDWTRGCSTHTGTPHLQSGEVRESDFHLQLETTRRYSGCLRLSLPKVKIILCGTFFCALKAFDGIFKLLLHQSTWDRLQKHRHNLKFWGGGVACH